MKYLFILFAGITLLYSCSPQVAETAPFEESPTEAKIESSDPQIIAGKVLWENDCTGCHNGKKVITDYTADQWKGILPGMIVNAKLNDEGAKQIRDYIHWVLDNQ